MKKISYIILIVVCLWMSGCDSFDVNLKDWQVGFCVDSVSFSGDWSHYNSIGVNNLYVEIDMEEHHNTPVKLNMAMSYNADDVPSVNVPDGKYVLDGDGTWYDHSTLRVDSDFQTKNSSAAQSIKTVSDSISLHNEYYYKLDLKYNVDNNSVLDLDIESDDGEWNIVPNGLNFKVDYDVVHDGTSDGPKLNLIVMAEGYRADQMDDYKAYVDYAFQDAAHFHYKKGRSYFNYHVTNKFFERYWDKIRIIRMDTISPQSGVDQKWYEDNVHTILNYNKEGCWTGCDFTRISHIMAKTKPCGMIVDSADAYIILVNDDSLRSYSFAYGMEIGYKANQPIHPVLIKALAGNQNASPDIYDKNVRTCAIAHELGHALARLQDEYEEDGKDQSYCAWYRNVDDDTNYKWQVFINVGYGGGTSSNHLIGDNEGGLYKSTGIYRPTYNSTMKGHPETNISYQFGPINTYFLVGSLYARLGKYGPHVPDVSCGTDGECYQWDYYLIDHFKKEWPPSDFQ